MKKTKKKKRRLTFKSKKFLLIFVVTTIFLLNLQHIKTWMTEYGVIKENEGVEKNRTDKVTKKLQGITSWDKFSTEKHYLDYEFYQFQHKNESREGVVSYIDIFYKKYLNELLELNYTSKQILALIKNTRISDFEVLIKNKYTYKDIKPYLNIKGMVYEDIPKYIASEKNPIQAVLYRSYPFIDSRYKTNVTYEIEEPENSLILIKKGFTLSGNFVPRDLVDVNIPSAPDNTNTKLRKEAAFALESMYRTAKKEGYHLVLNSGYRSFEEQKKIYDIYFEKYDAVTAASLVAVPGYSEHQLGLGADITSQSVVNKEKNIFGDTEEYKWITKNAYKYGFILRYPKDKTSITGIANEPWHIRYVGKKEAKIIYDRGWTLEEYILNNGFSYDLEKKG